MLIDYQNDAYIFLRSICLIFWLSIKVLRILLRFYIMIYQTLLYNEFIARQTIV